MTSREPKPPQILYPRLNHRHSNFFSMKLITLQLNPRYWSHLTILAFRASILTAWLRNHCFEAWAYKWSIDACDRPCFKSSSSLRRPSWKTKFTAFSISDAFIPLVKSAWFRKQWFNMIHIQIRKCRNGFKSMFAVWSRSEERSKQWSIHNKESIKYTYLFKAHLCLSSCFQ